jgi:hypothetical protein
MWVVQASNIIPNNWWLYDRELGKSYPPFGEGYLHSEGHAQLMCGLLNAEHYDVVVP